MARSRLKKAAETVVVYNPQARGVERNRLRHLFEHNFVGQRVDFCEYNRGEDIANRLAPWLEGGVQLVIAAGGDGTISDVASVLVESETPLGIIPLGTGNAVALELNIPLDAQRAAQLLSGPYAERNLDVLRVGDKAYLLSVGVGLGAVAMKETSLYQKKLLGRSAYWLPFFRNFFDPRPRDFLVELDGKRMQIRASELVAANAGIIGYKPLRWGPEVRLDDGLMHLCYLRARTGFGYFWAIFNFLRGYYIRNKDLNCLPARKSINILAPAGLPVQGDGDLIGYTPVEVRLQAAALKVAVPQVNH